MLAIRTVLCPVDFSPLGEREIELATAVCRRFGARLVLHHNLEAVSIGLSMGWMWNQVHAGEKPTAAMVEARLQELMAGLPEGIDGGGAAQRRPGSGEPALPAGAAGGRSDGHGDPRRELRGPRVGR